MNTNIMTNEENTTMKIRTYRRAIKCIETGNTYISISEAARETGINMKTINGNLTGRTKGAKGMHFEYLSEEETRELLNSMEPKEITIQRKAIIRGKGKCFSGNSNAVLCITTGDVLTSCTDAANHADVTVGHMSSVCRGNSQSAKGKRYCYVKDINEHLDEVAESIRKANMYDEFMTKEEKRKELVANVEHWESETKRIQSEITKLLNDNLKANEELEKARRELMYFSF